MTFQIDILEALGIDPETLKWQDLASCGRAPDLAENFFDNYEKSTAIAIQVDEICLTCPVVKECYDYGQYNEQTGVWGGFWLDKGEISSNRNKHKTPEIVSKLSERIFND